MGWYWGPQEVVGGIKMDGVSLLVYADFVVVLLADILAFGIIMRIYLQHKRKSALAFSVGWLFDFLGVLFSGVNVTGSSFLSPFFLATFGACVFWGSVEFLEEEGISIRHSLVKLFAVVPPTYMVYIAAVYYLVKDPEWIALAASGLGVAGVAVTAGGILLMEVKEIYERAIRYVYLSLILFGLHLIPAALFGVHEWYMPIGFTLSAILIVIMTTAMVRLTRSERFKLPRSVPKSLEIVPGVIIIDPSKYRILRETLSEISVLAFVREIREAPEQWNVYFVTTVDNEREIGGTISPTNLPRMTELAYQYLRDSAKSGVRGVVVIDCLEYLAIHNSWESLLKFLSKLRDFALMHGGTVVLVLDRESLEPKMYSQLQKLLE